MSARTEDMPLHPFRRMPFAELPERPTRPHPYLTATARELVMDSTSLGRLRVHYREYGTGPPLLLIHGLMTSGYSWRYVLDGLGAHYRVIIPDLPGAGASSAPTRQLSQVALAAWIGEFQTQMGLHGCPIVGNSLGGYLTMRHALTDPDAFRAVVNIHSPAVPYPRLHLLHAALSLPGAATMLRWWIQRDTTRWAHRVVHYYNESLKSREESQPIRRPTDHPGRYARIHRLPTKRHGPIRVHRVHRTTAPPPHHPATLPHPPLADLLTPRPRSARHRRQPPRQAHPRRTTTLDRPNLPLRPRRHPHRRHQPHPRLPPHPITQRQTSAHRHVRAFFPAGSVLGEAVCGR